LRTSLLLLNQKPYPRLFAPLVLLDVGGGRDPPRRFARPVALGHGAKQVPTVDPVPRTSEPHLRLEERSLPEGRLDRELDARDVVRVRRLDAEEAALYRVEAGEGGPDRIAVVRLAFRAGCPHAERHGIDERAHSLFVFLLECLAFPLAKKERL